MLSIQKKGYIKKCRTKIYTFYFELSSKTNVDIICIAVSMQKRHDFETVFTSDDVMNINITLENDLGIEKEHNISE